MKLRECEKAGEEWKAREEVNQWKEDTEREGRGGGNTGERGESIPQTASQIWGKKSLALAFLEPSPPSLLYVA